MERKHWVMDYETICNCFVACFVNKDNDETHIFVVHENKNQLREFIDFLKRCMRNRQVHISINGLYFDSQISQWILDNEKHLLSLTNPANEIYKYAQNIINTGNRDYPEYKLQIKQLDLSSLNGWTAKMVSLKWIQYAIDWHNIEEMPHEHNILIKTEKELDNVIKYCLNDVLSTKEIYNLSKEQIRLRVEISKKYNINLINASETEIAKKLLLSFLSEKLRRSKYEITHLKTIRSNIVLSECIFPYIDFKTNTFKSVLEFFKNTIISNENNEFSFKTEYKDTKIKYGKGGIHGAKEAGIYQSSHGWSIMSCDVKSYYPNITIRNKLHPEHIPQKEFCELYESIYNQRSIIPKEDPTNYVLKIVLNALSGLTGNQNSFLYDLKTFIQITVNGQLILSMLLEKICEEIPEATLLIQNTDGLEVMIPSNYKAKYFDICKEFEKTTELSLEYDEYKKIILRDVNNYIAININNKVKARGAFEWEELEKKKVSVLHKNKSFLIIPKAIYAYFVYNIKPEEYIRNNKKIVDYCAGIRTTGVWDLYSLENLEEKHVYLKQNNWTKLKTNEWICEGIKSPMNINEAFLTAIFKNEKVEKLQKTIRYYISNEGNKIIKVNSVDKRIIQIEAGEWKQTVVNRLNVNDTTDNYDINYDYYLEKIYEEINKIHKPTDKKQQLELF